KAIPNRRSLVRERPSHGMRHKINGWIRVAQRPKAADKVIARGRTRRSEVTERNRRRPPLVYRTLDVITEFHRTDECRIRIHLSHVAPGRRWGSVAAIVITP